MTIVRDDDELQGHGPWLEELMRTAPRVPMVQPFGGRVEEIPSTEATKRVLAASEPIEGSERPILETWGCLNYGLVVVDADDCAIEKTFNILREKYIKEGIEPDRASERANEDAEPYAAVAEVWPVSALPKLLQSDAESDSGCGPDGDEPRCMPRRVGHGQSMPGQ